MVRQSNGGAGQHLDNSRAFVQPGVGAVRNIGRPAVVPTDAVNGVPGAGRIVVDMRVKGIDGAEHVEKVPVAVVVLPTDTEARRVAALQQLRAQMRANLFSSRDLEALWSPVLDRIERSWANRGRKPCPEQAAAYELFDAEVAAGRSPEARGFRRVAANKLMRDPAEISRWLGAWKTERGYN